MSDRPDWLIVGQRHPDGGVVLFASKTMLGQAHFREEMRVHLDPYNHRPVGSSTPPVTFDVRMRDYVQVRADTYQAALAMLFEQWAPGSADPFAALEAPTITP